MKTIEQYFREYLESNGMFPQQADAVMLAVKGHDAAMEERWSDDKSGYPSSLLAAILMRVNRSAVIWIDANLPDAWFRPIFAGGKET